LTDIGHMVTVGGAQEDLVQNIENIVGGQANDTLTGNSEANTLIGGAGDDILYGGSTSRATTLGFTADPFPNGITINIAGLLSVALTGGSTGNDVAEQVRVALAADVRFSNFQIERTDNTLLIVAPAGDAVPILFSQFDMGGVNIDCTINAPSGMVNGVWYGENPYESILKQYGDRISGGVGNDTIDGGTGDNTAIFSRNFSDYTISSSAGTTTVRAITGPDGTDTLTNIRYLEFADLTWDLTTSTAAQVSGGSSGGSSSSSSSSSGNSTYVGRRKTQGTAQPSGPILVATGAKSSSILNTSPANQIVGSKGNDQLVGSESDDLIEAGAGDDVVTAGAGNDLIVGGNGEGDDLYIGGEGSDTVRYSSAKAGITVNLQLGSARSTLSGDAANIGVDTLREIENVIGGHHDDLLIGDAADNQIAGNGGNDIIEGGAGNDTAVFQGAKNSYTIKQADGGYLVTAANGDVVRLSNIEFLQFSDGVYRIALSTSSSSTALGQPHVGGISLRTQADASAAINTIDTALTYINRQRSALGTIMNVLDARARVLAAEKTNTYAARSKILDTDYAFETAMMARQMIIAQAGRAMLAMANQSGQQVLSLLR
jgi:Ca2+-binding RTX toxin-like protein